MTRIKSRKRREARDLQERKWSHCCSAVLVTPQQYNSAQGISYAYIATLLSIVTKDSRSFVVNFVTERTPQIPCALQYTCLPVPTDTYHVSVPPSKKIYLGSYPRAAVPNTQGWARACSLTRPEAQLYLICFKLSTQTTL
jgi:hypothetical protein